MRIINLDVLTYAGNLSSLDNLPDPGRHTFIQSDMCNSDLLKVLFQNYQIDSERANRVFRINSFDECPWGKLKVFDYCSGLW